LPELVGDAALQVDPDDTLALAEVISRLLADHAQRDELRQRGLARARSFTWERVAEQTMAVYQAAVERGSGGAEEQRSSGGGAGNVWS